MLQLCCRLREGAFDEVSNIMYRMKDLATQAANDTNTSKDRTAINSGVGRTEL
ncbi:Flagellin [Kluyvera cryocrescens]|uniref:Flagellin n=1 Tax=Kluyvera cryocrescens TaxID=580 RepID=A0A485AKF9_KLUCR|nr:Flagellin [Kluyvera cryocrescens]